MSFDKRSYERLPDGSMLACPGFGTSLAARIWSNGTIACVEEMIYTRRIVIAYPETPFGCWNDVWCFDKAKDIINALREWDYPTVPEPDGWHRHPMSNRRRIDGDLDREYKNEDEKRRLIPYV